MKPLLDLMGRDLKPLNQTLFCKRAAEAEESLSPLSSTYPLQIVIDSSGLKIMGEGLSTGLL